MGFEVITAMSVKMAVSCVVASCGNCLVEVFRCFRGECCLYFRGGDRPDDGRRKPEVLVNFYLIKIAVFWILALCSPIEVYQRLRGPCRP